MHQDLKFLPNIGQLSLSPIQLHHFSRLDHTLKIMHMVLRCNADNVTENRGTGIVRFPLLAVRKIDNAEPWLVGSEDCGIVGLREQEMYICSGNSLF
jgi:hypothetical protein